MANSRTPEEDTARDQFAAIMLRYFAEDHKLGNRFAEFGGDIRNQDYRRTQMQVAQACWNMADVMILARRVDFHGKDRDL